MLKHFDSIRVHYPKTQSVIHTKYYKSELSHYNALLPHQYCDIVTTIIQKDNSKVIQKNSEYNDKYIFVS